MIYENNCRQLLVDCFDQQGLISAVLNLWQAERKNL